MHPRNQSVLVVVDSRRPDDLRQAERAVFAALDHLGVAWQVYELGAATVASDFAETLDRDPMAPPGQRDFVDRYIGDRALYILAHDGAGRMPEPMARLIADAVAGGAGLLSFDREAAQCPSPLRDLLNAAGPAVHAESLVVAEEANPFLIVPHAPGKAFDLRIPVESLMCDADDATPLLRGPAGQIVAWTRCVGGGRVVVFGCGSALHDDRTFGHGRGATGLFWRPLVWAARKPFPMRCIPPYLTARFDDCNGSYDAFGYVDALNAVGIRPNIGLFVDEMSEADWQAAGALCGSGGADFSMHAFRDDELKHNPGWTPCRSMNHKPQFSEGAFKGFSLDHFTGEEYDDATVDSHFADMDRRFAEYGIRHSRIVNAHFADVSLRAVKRFLDRGVDIHVNNGVAGQLYGNQPVWRPRPFGLRTACGRYPLVIDMAPDRTGAFAAGVGTPPHAAARMETDILWGHTPFLNECDKVDVQGVVTRCVRNMEWALDSMAWGLFMAHEQRVACVPPDAWQDIVRGVADHFAGRDVEFSGREHVGVVTRRLFETRLARAWITADGLAAEFTGCSDGPSPLTLWVNDGESCRREVREVDAIQGFHAAAFTA